MAYVAISQDLKNRVTNKINKMRQREIAADLPNLERVNTIDASHMFNMGCWGAEHMHLISKIPKEWLAVEPSPTIGIVGTVDIEGLPTPVEVKKGIVFKGCTAAYRRPSTDYFNKSSSTLHIDDVRALPEGTFGRTEAIEQFEWACTEAQMNARWKKIEQDISNFLNKCKSLNEAIKLFPGIKMYVDEDDIERVNKKVSRAAREELVVDIDVDMITAAAIGSSLSI